MGQINISNLTIVTDIKILSKYFFSLNIRNMTNLYLVELDIEYKGIDYQGFLKLWLEDVQFYLSKHASGEVKQLWKVAGERKCFIVIEQSTNEMDKMMFS